MAAYSQVEHDRLTGVIELVIKSNRIHSSAVTDQSEVLSAVISDYVTRIATLEKRPRSEVLAEVISLIDEKNKESHLRIV